MLFTELDAPRVAVLLVGGLRDLDLTRASAFGRHVLAPLAKQTGGPVDLFACFETGDALSSDLKAALEDSGASVLWPDATLMETSGNWMQRLHNCYLSAKQHESPDRRYNFFLRTRPDLVWEGDFLPVADWNPNRVSARYRIYAGSRKFTAENQAYSRGHCGYNLPEGHGCAREGANCFIPDDQLFIVPARMANAVMNFYTDDVTTYPSNWCDQPPSFRLMGDSVHCVAWAEMDWGYYIYRNGVEIQLLAARAWLRKHGPPCDDNWTASFDCSAPHPATHFELAELERRAQLVGNQTHASTEGEPKERKKADRSRLVHMHEQEQAPEKWC